MKRKERMERRLESLRDECRRAAGSARVGELRIERLPDKPVWGSDESRGVMGVYRVTDARSDAGEAVEVWDFRIGDSFDPTCDCGDPYCRHEEAVRAFEGAEERREAEASRRCIRVEEMSFLEVFYEDGARGVYSGLREEDDPDTVDPRDLHGRGHKDARGSGVDGAEDIEEVLSEMEETREMSEPFVLTMHATRKDDWELHVHFCYAETGELVRGAQEHVLVRQTGRAKGSPRLDTLRDPEWMVKLFHACLAGTPLEQPESTRGRRVDAAFGVEVTDEVLTAVNGRRVRALLTWRDGYAHGQRLKKHTIELLHEDADGEASGGSATPADPGETGEARELLREAPPEPEGDAAEGDTPPRSPYQEGSMDDLRQKARRLGMDFADLLRAEASRGTAGEPLRVPEGDR